MAKRIYSEKFDGLYRYTAGGNLYFLHKGKETCLETPDEKIANAAREKQLALVSRFGSAGFKFRLRDLFPEFLKVKKKEVRPSTYELYEVIWEKHFEPLLGKEFIANINQNKWTEFCGRVDSVSDFQNPRNLMHQFQKWCESKELLMAVPTLKNPKHKRKRQKIVPPAHMVSIFQHAHGSLLLFITLALFHGFRRSEIIKLSWDRVDLISRVIKLGDGDVKTGEAREVPLNDLAYELLKARLAEQQAEGITTAWVFPNRKQANKRGKRIFVALNRHADVKGLMGSWHRCLIKAGLSDIGYTWHNLRATFEKHAHLSTDFTDTQKEKMVGADIDVQKKIYVSMDANDLRGLERVVTNKVPELTQIIQGKTNRLLGAAGKELGEEILSGRESEASLE